jgi:hypothetical protein
METTRQRIELAADDVKAFLASPAGIRFRRYLAAGVITVAPLVFRIPGLRRYPVLRLLEAVGGVALIVKAAEAIRDWDLAGQPTERIVIDVPPA